MYGILASFVARVRAVRLRHDGYESVGRRYGRLGNLVFSFVWGT